MGSNLNRAFGNTSAPGITGTPVQHPPAVTTTRQVPQTQPPGSGVTALAQLKALGNRLTPTQRTSIEMMEKFTQLRNTTSGIAAPDTKPRKP